MKVSLKRAYEKPSRSDGKRVLVDRLWPRGLTKQALALTAWLKDLAPSDELRKWYHERPDQWLQFRKRYLDELMQPTAAAALDELYQLSDGRLTLVFASRNLRHNNATVLKELLEGAKKPPTSSGPVKAAAANRARGRR